MDHRRSPSPQERLNEIKLSNDLNSPQVQMEQVFYRCIELLKEFNDIAKPFTPGLASSCRITLTWTAMEVVWKSDQIKQFRDRLSEAKTNLVITQNLSTSLDSLMTSTSNTIYGSEQVSVVGTRRKQIGTTRTSVTRTFLGKICCSVTKY